MQVTEQRTEITVRSIVPSNDYFVIASLSSYCSVLALAYTAFTFHQKTTNIPDSCGQYGLLRLFFTPLTPSFTLS